MLADIALVIGAYLLGAVPYMLLLGRAKGFDLSQASVEGGDQGTIHETGGNSRGPGRLPFIRDGHQEVVHRQRKGPRERREQRSTQDRDDSVLRVRERQSLVRDP